MIHQNNLGHIITPASQSASKKHSAYAAANWMKANSRPRPSLIRTPPTWHWQITVEEAVRRPSTIHHINERKHNVLWHWSFPVCLCGSLPLIISAAAGVINVLRIITRNIPGSALLTRERSGWTTAVDGADDSLFGGQVGSLQRQ